jgi:hypothetical protein
MFSPSSGERKNLVKPSMVAYAHYKNLLRGVPEIPVNNNLCRTS